MQCPITTFDCISCEEKCMLAERRRENDPFRRGNDLRTCDAELARLGMRTTQPAQEYCRGGCGTPIIIGELCANCAEGNDPFKTCDNAGRDLR